MDFSLEDVSKFRYVFLEGARDKWSRENIYEPETFQWDEDYWFEMDHIFIEPNANKFVVSVVTDCVSSILTDCEGITAEQVVELVHRLSHGNHIENLIE